MNGEAQIQVLEHKVGELIAAEPDLFLVEVKIKPTNNIKVFIDGDRGISIEKLVQYNRRLYKQIEEENMFPNGDFSLEVSSPGVDEPLKMHRQYLKNFGRFAEVTDKEGNKKTIPCKNPSSIDAYNDIKRNMEAWVEEAIRNNQ